MAGPGHKLDHNFYEYSMARETSGDMIFMTISW